MSEIGETWKAVKEASKVKRASNREYSTKLLQEKQIKFTEYNGGAHLRVETTQGVIDFWPGTGYWKTAGGIKGRGVNNLLSMISKFK